MRLRQAYQTVERKNVRNIEGLGPFKCIRNNAWLGQGYYFWDSFIDIAHWWGRHGAGYTNGYIICESTYDIDGNKCFDLYDNPVHLEQFNLTKSILQREGLYEDGKTTVARVIEHIRMIGVFSYEAIRAYGVNSVNFNSEYCNRTVFITPKDGRQTFRYLDSMPAIQINFFDKKSLNRQGYKIVYQSNESEQYLV